MDYFEHEMQMFFGESALLSADTVFSHRAMVSDSLIHYRAFYDNIGSFKRIEAYFSELSLKAGKV